MNLMRGIDLKKIAVKLNGASGAELKVKCTLLYLPNNFLQLLSKVTLDSLKKKFRRSAPKQVCTH